MKEIPALTGIRFVAAGWVVAYHLRSEIGAWCPSLAPLNTLLLLGHFAVPLFFILSGFILCHVYFPTYTFRQHGNFIFRRFARLWPVHCATVLALLAYVVASIAVRGYYVPAAVFPMAALPYDLLMVRCWWSSELLWNFPAWTIHCEWLAYLVLFPLCFHLLRAIRKPLHLLLILCSLLTAHVYFAEALPGKSGEIVFLFAAGSALYCLRMAWSAANGSVITLVGAALFIVGYVTQHGSPFYLAFACLVLGLSYEQGWLNRFFSSRPLVYGGAISYSLYMTHEVVHKYAAEAIKHLSIRHELQGYAVLFGLVGFMLAAAMITHHFIEVPANRRLRNLVPPSTVRIGPGALTLSKWGAAARGSWRRAVSGLT